MGLKENLRNKIEKNAVKSNLTWTDKEGISHTEEVILKKSTAPLGDWGRIYPPVNEDGTWNVVNLLFGGWRNLVKLLITFGIIALVMFQFYEDFLVIEHLRNTCVSIFP